MKYLLDTQILLWAAMDAKRLSPAAREVLGNADNQLHFSAASVWEVAIKNSLGGSGFSVDPQLFRRALLDNGYIELSITSQHAAATALLPDIHRDPFDRVLIAQAATEGMTFLTADSVIARYSGPIVKV